MRSRSVQLELPLEFRRSENPARGDILISGSRVTYAIRRSERCRRITLTIDERGLRVSAPARASQHALENELQAHGKWVLRKLAEWERRRPAAPRWADGEPVMFLGEPLRLTLSSAEQTSRRDGERLFLGTPGLNGPDRIAAAVTAWLREQALACFHARVAHFAPQLLVPAPAIRLSNARTRWGSCHAAGRVQLHWRLIQLPLALVDYVVVHELAHLREMNHSARFWRTVAQVIPDYAARRKAIRIDACRYLLV